MSQMPDKEKLNEMKEKLFGLGTNTMPNILGLVKNFKDIEEKINILNSHVLELKNSVAELDRRLEIVEAKIGVETE